MTLRLRVWLSTLAVCFIPSTALAQRHAGQPALAPVALEARQSLGDLPWDPMIRVAALTPPTIHDNSAETAAISPAAAATKAATRSADTKPAAKEAAAKKPVAKKAAAKKAAAKPSRCPALAAAEPDRFLTGYVLTDSLDLAAAVDPAAVEPAIDRALAVLAQEEPLDVVTTGGSASPVIATLPQAEEYLPYDLAALDRLQLRLFPYGLPHFLGPLMPLVHARSNTEDAQAEVAQAEVAEAEIAAEAGRPLDDDAAPTASLAADIPLGPPVDCLLDDLFWHANQLMDHDAAVRRMLQPYELGRRLARFSHSSATVADRWVPRLAAAVAPRQPVLVGPPRPPAAAANLLVLTPTATPQAASSAAPSVCCPPPANRALALAEDDIAQPQVGRPGGDLRAEVLRSAADSLEALAAAMRSLSDRLDHRRLAAQPVAGPHVR